ncbi:MAG: hypothetical protein IPO66_00965 [Rhodanobacteraceae bacterium]|nr:hypothetical protein [Rhodanobacteraceae bacterium]
MQETRIPAHDNLESKFDSTLMAANAHSQRPKGLNFRRVTAIAVTLTVHSVLVGLLLLPASAPTGLQKPQENIIEVVFLEPPPPPPTTTAAAAAAAAGTAEDHQA